jgi:hypothetical protein
MAASRDRRSAVLLLAADDDPERIVGQRSLQLHRFWRWKWRA